MFLKYGTALRTHCTFLSGKFEEKKTHFSLGKKQSSQKICIEDKKGGRGKRRKREKQSLAIQGYSLKLREISPVIKVLTFLEIWGIYMPLHMYYIFLNGVKCLKIASFWVINVRIRFMQKREKKGTGRGGGGIIEMHNIYPCVKFRFKPLYYLSQV